MKKHSVVLSLFFLMFALRLTSCRESFGPASEAIKTLPIQHNGRVMSFDCFSRQVLSTVIQKDSWKRRPAWSVILQAASDRKASADLAWIKIGYDELISSLGLPLKKDRIYSYSEIFPNMDKLESLIGRAQSKDPGQKRLKILGQKAEAVDAALYQVQELMTGKALRVIPPVKGDEWSSPYFETTLESEAFKKLMDDYKAGREKEFSSALALWIDRIGRQTHFKYQRQINLEVLYYGLKPFEIALILYLLAFVCISLLKARDRFLMPGMLCLTAAMVFHTLGLLLRMLILARPPVSNMYESIIFANWTLMLAAVIFSAVRKTPAVVCVGSLISAVIMVYGNLLPIDAGLDVLAPVLRSNYWLAMHVMTIVASYGIFALAMGLGHRQLYQAVRGHFKPSEEEKSAQIIYRSLQIGLLLSGVGIVLGGVWANETWGRFWGWDPKETWALITFLGYVVVMHLYFKKKIHAFGLAVASILSFQLVLMTWYGVNFVLGTGLHSYGQGSGGAGWVVLYLVFETFFLLWAVVKRPKKT